MFTPIDIREDVKEVVDETAVDTNRYSASKIAPELLVRATAGDMKTKPSGNGLKNLDIKKAPRGSFQRTEGTTGTDTYSTNSYGLEVPIDLTEALENEEFFDEEVEAGKNAKSLLFVAREKRVADAVFNSTTFAGATNQMAASAVWDTAAAKLWKDVNDAFIILKAKFPIRKMMLSVILAEDIFNLAMRSTEVREDVKYTKDINTAGESAQAGYLANFLGVKEVVLVASQYDTTAEGVANGAFSDIWNPDFAMLALLPSATNSWNTKGVARQPVWSKFSTDYRIESYDEKATDSRVIRARDYRGEKVRTKYGVLITGVAT